MIVELAARGAGFKVFTEILSRVTGLSTTLASIQTSLGKQPDLALRASGSAASLVFVDPVPGVLHSVQGVEAARALSGISEVVIYVESGQLMNELRSGSDRAGHILSYGTDPVACRARAHTALDQICLLLRS